MLWAVLKSYGVEDKLITLIKETYKKAQSAIRINKENGEWFHTNVGTRQGDPLSPLLFITYLERIMDLTQQNPYGVNLNGTLVNNLRFADDIDLIDEKFDNLVKQVETTTESAKRVGLIINTKKTKIMVFGEQDNGKDMKIAGESIENVNKFEYLGSLLTWDNNCTEYIKRRIGKATGTLVSLKHIISDGNIKVDQKIQILTTTVFSVLLYASETWTLKENDKKRLLAFEMKCYRRILKIKWTEKRTNEDIRKMICRKYTIIDIIKKRKLQLFGHICRMSDSRLVKQIVFSRMEGKSRIGRPSREWLDDIADWCNHNIQDLYQIAQNRRSWKDLILSSIGPDGR